MTECWILENETEFEKLANIKMLGMFQRFQKYLSFFFSLEQTIGDFYSF